MQPTQGSARVIRVGVLGTSTLALAASAHLSGGGQLPEPWVLAFLALGIGGIATVMTAGRCRLIPLIAALGGLQFVVHVLFGALADAGVHAPGGMSSADYLAAAACGSMTPGGADHFGLGMILGHVVATLATAALLARGEAWMFSLADRAVRHANASVGAFDVPARPAQIVGLPRIFRARNRNLPAAPRGPPPSLIAPSGVAT